MNRPASYYFTTLEVEKITRQTDHGLQEGSLSLCEFFGNYFVVFTSYADAQELASMSGSFDAAERTFRRILKQTNVVVAA